MLASLNPALMLLLEKKEEEQQENFVILKKIGPNFVEAGQFAQNTIATFYKIKALVYKNS